MSIRRIVYDAYPEHEGFIAHPNDMSLFQIVDTFYSEHEEAEIFEECFPLSVHPLRFIENTLERTLRMYKEYDELHFGKQYAPGEKRKNLDMAWRYCGYMCKIEGSNMQNMLLQEEYLSYRDHLSESQMHEYIRQQVEFNDMESLDIPGTRVKCSYDAAVEMAFFCLLSDGILTANFEARLLKLKKQIENGTYFPHEQEEGESHLNNESDKQIKNIAWLHELGIINHVMRQCKVDNKVIPLRVAKVINSFTGIGIDAIRKAVIAINDQNTRDSHHPFSQKKNREYAQRKRSDFRMLENPEKLD